MNHITKRFLLVFVMVFCVCLSMATPALAKKASEVGLSVKRNADTRDKGLYKLNFTITNKWNDGKRGDDGVHYAAKLVSSSGKTVKQWDDFTLRKNTSSNRWFGFYPSKYPAGKYTFKITAIPERVYNYPAVYSEESYTWKYEINSNPVSITFGKLKSSTDTSGNKKFTINFYYTGLKGKKITYEIYNSKGDLVSKYTGKTLPNDSDDRNYTWNGYPAKGPRVPSGEYTFVFSAPGCKVQKTYKLNF